MGGLWGHMLSPPLSAPMGFEVGTGAAGCL